MKPKKIYIAGKVTNLPYNQVQQKFEAAETKLQVMHKLNVVNPTKLVKQETPWNIAMVQCITHLQKCDAIFLLPDWNQSEGALVEVAWAIENKIKIYTDFKQIEN
jgi:hypothetical protein